MKLNAKQTKQLLEFYLTSSNKQLVPALVGLTGVGKTAVSKLVAEEIGAKLIYFNLAQLSEGELALPVPVQNEIKEKTSSMNEVDKAQALVRYSLNFKIREAMINPEQKYIIFVDEFTRGTIPVISEWMTILNERQIQGYKFEDNVRFMVAMNPTSTMYGYADTEYVTTEMDDAHANRFTFIDMDADLSDWLEWAESNKLNHIVISFLKDRGHQYFYGKETDGIRMRTPRTWDYLAQTLTDLENRNMINDEFILTSVVEQQLGHDIAPIFTAFALDLLSTLTTDKVFTDKRIDQKTVKQFVSYDSVKQASTIESLLQYIVSNKDITLEDIGKKGFENLHLLISKINSNDVRFSVYRDLVSTLSRENRILKGDVEKIDIFDRLVNGEEEYNELNRDFASEHQRTIGLLDKN